MPGVVPFLWSGLGGLRGGFSSNWLIVVCDDYHVLAWGGWWIGEDGLEKLNVVLQGLEEEFQQGGI